MPTAFLYVSPPITNITQSQTLSRHIFHLSLSPLSSINLNIRTPTARFRKKKTKKTTYINKKNIKHRHTAVVANVLTHVCISPFPASCQRLVETHPSSVDGACSDALVCVCVSVCPVPAASGESGRTSPSGGFFKC